MSTRSPDSAGSGTAGDRGRAASLDELSRPDHRQFVENAYRAILDRAPTPSEESEMLAGLLRGDTKTWLLGRLRYTSEGRARDIAIPGLGYRYLAQRLFRLPGAGPLAEWINGIARLPNALRHFRAMRQVDAERERWRREADDARFKGVEDDVRRLSEQVTALRLAGAALEERQQATLARVEAVRSTTLELQARLDAGNSAIDELRSRLDDARTSHDELRARFGAIARPSLDETLEIRGQPLAGLAKEKVGLPADTSIGSLAPHVRYTLFESVFYDSAAVAAKQRVYLRYIDGDLFSRLPFLDLGCGRGEFLHILRERGIECVGVDQNPACVAPLQAAGFDAVEQDLLAFLESDRRTYSGCSLLQVAEHLTSDQLERALALIAGRLAPGALLIVETPNPLSLFALSVFHTDPTHVTPLPPERLRYSIEAAGFHQALTLFQARIPEREFAGPDPRGYYGDYAIIARRSFEREQRQDDTAGGAR